MVPRDLTVVGFDDIPMASWPLVDLTTIRCDLDALAQQSVELLLREIDAPSASPPVHVVPVVLRLRGTHGPPGHAVAGAVRRCASR